MANIVGYRGKPGKLANYRLLGKAPDKFDKTKQRAHLASLDGKFDFWVDADKLVMPIPSTTPRKGSCDCPCCVPRCYCDSSCNCRGGNIYDC